MTQEASVLNLAAQLMGRPTEESASLRVLKPASCPILFVDDSPEQRRITERAFRGTGFPLQTLESAEGLIERVRRGDARLIYLDVHLGNQDGLQILRQLKQDPETAHVPVVIVTSSRDKNLILEAAKCGCDGYVVKPIEGDLVERSYEILTKHYFSDQPLRSFVRRFPKDSRLVRENQPRRALFFLKEGNVRVHIERNGHETVLATLGPGDVFGEESFLLGTLPSASVTTENDATLLIVEAPRDFDGLAREKAVFREVLDSVFKKLRKANETLAVYSHQNRIKTRHLGIDLTKEYLYAEVRRLLTLTRMVYLADRRRPRPATALREALGALAVETPFRVGAFVRALVENGFLVPVPGVSPGTEEAPLAIDEGGVDAFIERLGQAERTKSFIVVDDVAVNVIKLLEAVRVEKTDETASAPIPLALVNPSSSEHVRQALQTLQTLGLVRTAGEEKSGLLYAPKNLDFFLRWQRVLRAFAPPDSV